MKNIFRKAITVLGSAALIGMTVGVASAASYPSPFTSNTAIVVGANAAPSDNIAASSIASNLDANAAGGTVVLSGEGDVYKIEKTSTKFHLGDYIGNITTSNLDEDELPTLLAKGKYVDDDNEEFDYTQKIRLDVATTGAIQLKMFNDNDYAKDEPTIGFRLTDEQFIMNYTLDFTDKPAFDKLETTDLSLMGKDYYVLTVSADNTTITLLDSADSATISEGETKTIIAGGKSYDVSISNIGSNSEAKLIINGEITPSLAATETRKLADGAYVGIKDVSYTASDTRKGSVEFSIGSGKLKIENGQKVEINDEDVKNVYGYVVASSLTLDDIVLKWTADDETFLASGEELTMPGFEAVKLTFGGMDFPAEEEIVLQAGGNNYVELSDFPLVNGGVDIAILGKASGNTNYTFIGSDTDELLITSTGATLTFNGTSSSNDEMFVASWNDGRDAESYLVRATGFSDPSSGDDTVDIEYNDGSGWTKKYDDAEQSDTVSFGNVEMTLTIVNSTTANKTVTFTQGSTDVIFDELYSAEDLKIELPVLDTTSSVVSANNITGKYATAAAACIATFTDKEIATSATLAYTKTSDNVTYNANCQKSTYDLVMIEEDKDGDVAAGGVFNITIGNNGASNYYSSVTDVNNASVTREKDDTDVYQLWKYSALATKFVEDDSGDQDYVTITYHGDEVEADVYITSPDATTTSGGEAGVMTVTDANVGTAAGKNLVVVGGSAINSVAAELLGSAYSESAFTSATGVAAGQFLIQSFNRNGKTALLVAGYNAADTEKATTYLLNNVVDTTVGKKYKGTSATEANLVVA